MKKPYKPTSLPIPNLNWASFVRQIGKANAALARYDGILQGIINPAVLLSPLTTQEAVLSSKIEGTNSTLEEVLEFEASPKKEASRYEDIREILNYRNAMQVATELLEKRPINLSHITTIHDVLLDNVRGQNKARGKFRTEQNWIGRAGSPIEQATFVPPEPLGLIEYLSNFENYIHYNEEDRLVQLAIIHAQFELIHPFHDGNGRVGRILIPLFLYEKNLLHSPMFYLSAYLEQHRDIYYAKLGAISGHGDWDGWIDFFLTAIIEQAQINTQKVKSINSLHGYMKKVMPGITPSQYIIQTIDTLFSQPIFTSSEFTKRSGIPKASAARLLNTLQKENVLTSIQEARGRRPAILMFTDLISIVEGKKVV